MSGLWPPSRALQPVADRAWMWAASETSPSMSACMREMPISEMRCRGRAGASRPASPPRSGAVADREPLRGRSGRAGSARPRPPRASRQREAEPALPRMDVDKGRCCCRMLLLLPVSQAVGGVPERARVARAVLGHAERAPARGRGLIAGLRPCAHIRVEHTQLKNSTQRVAGAKKRAGEGGALVRGTHGGCVRREEHVR